MSEELLALSRATGALLDGHLVPRSGLHGRRFFQCALLLQHTEIATEVCGQLAAKWRGITADAVISPALGGNHCRSGSGPHPRETAYLCGEGSRWTGFAARIQNFSRREVRCRRRRGDARGRIKETIHIVALAAERSSRSV